MLPPGAAGPASGADQRIAPGLVVQLGDPGQAQGLNGGVSSSRPHRQSAVPAGRGERDCPAVLLPARPPARASALARATSVSRGPGGSTSCQGRSRRTLGRWIRICATFLISSAIHPSRGDDGGQPRPWEPALRGPLTARPGRPWGLFCEGRYEPPPAVGVTRRCTARWNLLRRALARRCHRIGLPARARGARGSGPGFVPGLRPRCGWPRRTCPGRG